MADVLEAILVGSARAQDELTADEEFRFRVEICLHDRDEIAVRPHLAGPFVAWRLWRQGVIR